MLWVRATRRAAARGARFGTAGRGRSMRRATRWPAGRGGALRRFTGSLARVMLELRLSLSIIPVDRGTQRAHGSPVSMRQKAWARWARARLTAQLGGQCQICGERHALQFHCINPRGDGHHRLDTSARMSFYHAQHARGNVMLVCADCHAQIRSRVEQVESTPRLERSKALRTQTSKTQQQIAAARVFGTKPLSKTSPVQGNNHRKEQNHE
jgi:hypothetical protein